MGGPFVNPNDRTTEDVVVPCPCEGSPHETDTVQVRKRFSGAEISKAMSAGFKMDQNGAHADIFARDQMLMEIAVVGWSFTDENGPIPFDVHMIPLLRHDIWALVSERVDKILEESGTPLAKPSTDGSTPTDDTTMPDYQISTAGQTRLQPNYSTHSLDLASKEPTT